MESEAEADGAWIAFDDDNDEKGRGKASVTLAKGLRTPLEGGSCRRVSASVFVAFSFTRGIGARTTRPHAFFSLENLHVRLKMNCSPQTRLVDPHKHARDRIRFVTARLEPRIRTSRTSLQCLKRRQTTFLGLFIDDYAPEDMCRGHRGPVHNQKLALQSNPPPVSTRDVHPVECTGDNYR